MNHIKKAVWDLLLCTGQIVTVQAIVAPCILPPFAAPVVALDYGLNMATPIPDLETDGAGIHGTLSFSRVACKTFVPWEAVQLMGHRENGQWVSLVVFQEFGPGEQPVGLGGGSVGPPKLRVVK